MVCLTESKIVTHHLPKWASELLSALEIDPVDVNTDGLHQIADTVNEDPGTDQLLVGFIAGYAAGLAQGSGMAKFDTAHAASVRFMTKHLIRE